MEEVAKELNLDIKDVNMTYDLWLKFLNYIANETDQASITFPHLGRLYVSTQKIRTGLHTERLKKFRDRKMSEIKKLECKYNNHEYCVPIILKYGISKKNCIPYILGKTDHSDFYSVNEIVNNQTNFFFKEDYEFSENEKIKEQFIRHEDN